LNNPALKFSSIPVSISADLPTPITCKSGGFEKKPRKTGRLGPQTWKLPKYASNKNNNDRFFALEYSLLYRELLSHDRVLASQTVRVGRSVSENVRNMK